MAPSTLRFVETGGCEALPGKRADDNDKGGPTGEMAEEGKGPGAGAAPPSSTRA